VIDMNAPNLPEPLTIDTERVEELKAITLF
jgi:hypothetical protein